MIIFFEVLASLVECWISMNFLTKYFEFKEKNKGIVLYIITFLMISADNVFLSQAPNMEFLSILVFIILSIFYSILALKGNVIEKIYCSFMMIISISLINMLLINITGILFQVNNISILHDNINTRLLMLFTTKFAYFLITKLMINVKKKNQYNFSKAEWLFLISFFIISYMMCASLWQLNRNQENFNAVFYMIIILALIIINIMLYLLLQKLGKDNLKKIELALYEQKYNSQKKLLSDALLQYDEIRTLRHDLTNYVDCSLTLIRQGNYEKAEQYLEDFSKSKVQTIIPLVLTSSEIIDAVINTKLSICARKNIKTQCDINERFPNTYELDLSILVSNLFDNAIEACENSICNNEILLITKRQKNYFNISMKNKIAKSVLQDNPELNTSKKKKANHGFGLKSIMKIVKAHDGMLDFYEESGYFIVEILLKV